MTNNKLSQLRLFDKLRATVKDEIHIIQATKATLVHMSHALENIVLTHHIPALIFTGFQESSYWQQETERYRDLSHVARQICIFAGKPLPESSQANQLHIELGRDDPLLQEWFLAIISNEFSVVLCGQDLGIPAEEEATRVFDTIWTFDPTVINMILDTLEQSINTYRPEKLPVLQEARASYTITAPASDLMSDLMSDLLHFEEQLNLRLIAQEKQWTHIIQALSHVVYVVDFPGHIRYISPKIENLTGYTVTEFMDNNQLWLSLIHESEQDAIQDKLTSLNTVDQLVNEYRIYTKQGEIRWVRDSVRVQRNPADGSKIQYGVLEDITDKKFAEEMERERETLSIQLLEERKMHNLKTRFMYTVSHEFRTPMATILSSSEMLERYYDKLTDDRRGYHVATIKEQLLHLRALLDDINTVLDDDTPREVIPAPLDIQTFMQNTLNTLFDHKGNTHTLNFTHDYKQTIINADPRLIRQIITNLINNARKYSPEHSQIDVTVRVADGQIDLSVRDYGIGIPEDDQKYLFDPFHRGNNVGAIGGTGMGLAIIADCVEAHRGKITYQTAINKGTTFFVMLSAL